MSAAIVEIRVKAGVVADYSPRAFIMTMGGGRKEYLPKSQVQVSQLPGQTAVIMPKWLAEAKGLQMLVVRTQEAEPEPLGEVVVTEPIDDGYYTVVEEGTHRTLFFKTYTETHGKQLVGVMFEGASKGVGWLIEGRVEYWGKSHWFNVVQRKQLEADLKVVARDPEAAQDQYALKSNRCCKCDADLTHPDSINRSMGPTCAKKYRARMANRQAVAA